MKPITFLITLFSVLMLNSSLAQDGEALYKAKCSACHILGKDGTGPNLNKVRQKWADAGEEEFIYEWVKNPQELVASGKSQVAIKSEAYSAIPMPPQDLTKEEIDAIFEYIDAHSEKAKTEVAASEETSEKSQPTVVEVPDYDTNLILFYLLIILIIVQLIVLSTIYKSIKGIINLDPFKNKFGIILAFIAVSLFNNNSYALALSEEKGSSEGLPWLLVDNSDLIILVIVNFILLLLVLYFKKLLNDLVKTIRTEDDIKEEPKFSKILVDAVPIEEEDTILMEHEYDGIRELDNRLPPWWLWMFYATIIFAIVYVFNYMILGTGDSQIEEYNKSIKIAEQQTKKYLKEQGMQIDENNVTITNDEKDLAEGKTLFETNCIACHGPNGEGNIGPNLTDRHWIYGYEIGKVFKTIKNGTSKGMP